MLRMLRPNKSEVLRRAASKPLGRLFAISQVFHFQMPFPFVELQTTDFAPFVKGGLRFPQYPHQVQPARQHRRVGYRGNPLPLVAHVAFMLRGAAGSQWRPLKLLGKVMQHARDDGLPKMQETSIESEFLTCSQVCFDGFKSAVSTVPPRGLAQAL